MANQTAANYIGIGLLLGIIGLLVVLLFGGVDINSTNNKQDADINQAIEANRAAGCAVANNLSLAFREPAPGENRNHFEDRMAAQFYALRQAQPLHCGALIPHFTRRFNEALAEIRAIIGPDYGRPGHAGSRNADVRKPSTTSSEGVVPSTASTPPSIATPPSGGDGGNGGPGGDVTVVTPPTTTTTPTQPDNSVLGPVLDGTCDTVSNLGVELC